MRARRNLVLCFVLAANVSVAQASTVIPPESQIAGASQEEWSRRWWNWALSFEDEQSPIADRTGARCGNGQSGPVWFLAGTYGTQRTQRTCKVPQGKTLFFPLINYITYPAQDSRESCLSLMSRAARLTQTPAALVMDLGGIRQEGLMAHRQASRSCFPLVAADIPVAASNGFYVALEPLPPGVHVLNFGGILPSMSQAVTYTLVVE